MGRKRIILALVMLMAFGASMTSGLAIAQPKGIDGSLSPSGSFISDRCSGLLFSSEPSGDAHCDSHEDSHEASANEDSGFLGVTTTASTTTELDPTGLLGSGQALARASGTFAYEGRLRGPASTVTVTVEATNINASASANSPSVSGRVFLFVRAWPHMAFSEGVQEFVVVADSPGIGAPSSVEDGTHTFELVLNADRMRAHINIRVSLIGESSVGFLTCDDKDDDGVCRGDEIQPHDGSGIATANASLKINSVTMEVTR